MRAILAFYRRPVTIPKLPVLAVGLLPHCLWREMFVSAPAPLLTGQRTPRSIRPRQIGGIAVRAEVRLTEADIQLGYTCTGNDSPNCGRPLPQPAAREPGFPQSRDHRRATAHQVPDQAGAVVLDHQYHRPLVDAELVRRHLPAPRRFGPCQSRGCRTVTRRRASARAFPRRAGERGRPPEPATDGQRAPPSISRCDILLDAAPRRARMPLTRWARFATVRREGAKRTDTS
jgi:hypothetical protein